MGKQNIKDRLTLFLIRHSSLFDARYYRERAGIPESTDAAEHYYRGGWRDADPSARFSQADYLAANRDVREAGVCPLGHYLLDGRRQRRRLRPGTPDMRFHAYRPLRAARRALYELLLARKIRRNRGARILVAAHAGREEALPELAEYLKNLRRYDCTVVVTVPRDAVGIQGERIRALGRDVRVCPVEKRGRDLGAFLTALGMQDLSAFDLVFRVQTTPPFPGKTYETGRALFRRRDWFAYAMESVLGARRVHLNIDRLLCRDRTRMVTARALLWTDSENRARLYRLRLRERGMELKEDRAFPAGGCYALRAEDARKIRDCGVSQANLDLEETTGDTFTSAMERWIFQLIPEEDRLAVRVCPVRRAAEPLLRLRTERKEKKEARARLRLAEAGEGKPRADAQPEGGVPAGVEEKRGLTVAFAVTETGERAVAGDYFTALELAEALEKKGCRTRFLARNELRRPWEYPGEDTDVLISMLPEYPMRRIGACAPGLFRIGWARNWFDAWMETPDVDRYDLLLSSSPRAKAEMEEVLRRKVELFPIATNWERFQADAPENASPREGEEKYRCDYCFTGNRFAAEREIEKMLHPEELPYTLKIFGDGWERNEALSPYCCGHVSYPEMPAVYRNTRIVLDDATLSTLQSGAVNSRVYDAIAAGCLVLTNNAVGAAETFEGKLPVYHDRASLKEQLILYLEDEALRKSRVRELQELVFRHHTYDLRAELLLRLIGRRKEGE